jgi:predicted aspartyl protease
MLDRYRLNHHGSLLWTKAAFHSPDRDVIITARMLIDTGASFTALSDRLISAILDNPIPLRQQSIATASQNIMAPVIAIPRFNCLGKQLNSFAMLTIPIPRNAFIDGLIGIDFLRSCGALIDIERSEIIITK